MSISPQDLTSSVPQDGLLLLAASKALWVNSNSSISDSWINGTAKREAKACKAAATGNACFASSRCNGATQVTEPEIDSISPSSSRRFNASRTGVRLIPTISANSLSCNRCSGCNSRLTNISLTHNGFKKKKSCVLLVHSAIPIHPFRPCLLLKKSEKFLPYNHSSAL